MARSPMEGNLAILIRITTPLTFDPAMSLMGIYSPDIPGTGTKLRMAWTRKTMLCSVLHNSERLEIIQVAISWGLVTICSIST